MRYAIHTSGARFPDTNRLFQCNSLSRLTAFMAHYKRHCEQRGYSEPVAFDNRQNCEMARDANGCWKWL